MLDTSCFDSTVVGRYQSSQTLYSDTCFVTPAIPSSFFTICSSPTLSFIYLAMVHKPFQFASVAWLLLLCVCCLVCRIEITPDTTLTLDNTIVRPSTLNRLSDLGPSTSVEVAVFNDGPSTAPGASLTINWPLQTENSGPYILYPTSVSV